MNKARPEQSSISNKLWVEIHRMDSNKRRVQKPRLIDKIYKVVDFSLPFKWFRVGSLDVWMVSVEKFGVVVRRWGEEICSRNNRASYHQSPR